MNHCVSDNIGTIGLGHSISSLVLLFEFSFDVACQVVGGIVFVEG